MSTDNNLFPHDGEHGRNCTGYGCDCDEKNYGQPSSGGGSCLEIIAQIIVAVIMLALIASGVNAFLLLLIILGIIFLVCYFSK